MTTVPTCSIPDDILYLLLWLCYTIYTCPTSVQAIYLLFSACTFNNVVKPSDDGGFAKLDIDLCPLQHLYG